ISQALNWIQALGQLLDKAKESALLLEDLYGAFASLHKGPALRVAYAIWKDPWIWVGGDNYISDMLRLMGWTNVLADQERYPRLEREAIMALSCDLILLSTEPYPFSDAHIRECRREFPGQRFRH